MRTLLKVPERLYCEIGMLVFLVFLGYAAVVDCSVHFDVVCVLQGYACPFLPYPGPYLALPHTDALLDVWYR